MSYTWGEVRETVEADLDLAGEDFSTASELMSLGQRAVNKAEALILTLNEDYLLAPQSTITLVSGTATYSLPTGIYAHKLRRLFYNDGSTKYRIDKIKNLDETQELESGDALKYLITNNPDPTIGAKITFYPTPAVNGAYIRAFFLRNANVIEDDDSVIELPEAFDYIVQFVKDGVINKERQTPDAPPSGALLDQEKILIETLTVKTPDDNNELMPTDDYIVGNVAMYEDC